MKKYTIFEGRTPDNIAYMLEKGFRALFIVVIAAIFPVITVSGQKNTTCPNSDFSGGFTNWSAYYGIFENPALEEGVVDGRHTVISSPGRYDYNTCDGLFTLPAGSQFCARLGNDDVGAEAEQLRYSLTVTDETNLFIYKYAVVLQDPGHVPEHQPNFTIVVANQSGTIIDPVCGYYYVYAQQDLPTWHSCPDREVVWKDWTTVGIDLTPYMGQAISIVFTTKDCQETGHFGYAYISTYCSKLEIQYGFCPNDTVASVTAPPGFSYLWDTGDTSQTIIIHHPVPGQTDSCILTSVNGCKVTIQGVFQPTVIHAGFDAGDNCVGSGVQFTDRSTINQYSISNWKWDFGDGSPDASGISTPMHIYTSPGVYSVKMVAYSNQGCPDSVTKTLRIARVPDTTFSIDPVCGLLNQQDLMFFDGQARLSLPGGYTRYTWSTGDTTSWVDVSHEGWYKVEISDYEICTVTDSVQLLPCYVLLTIPNAFSPNGDGVNERFRPVVPYDLLPGFNMIIFNRWGQIIFETHDPEQGWNGNVNGSGAPAGEYPYLITFQHPSGVAEKRNGLVMLVR